MAAGARTIRTLTSFETFDTLAGTTRGPEEVVPLVHHLACAALGLFLHVLCILSPSLSFCAKRRI